MTDLLTVSRIASLVDAITSDDDLKLVSREVHRRAMKLDTLRAAGFKRGDRVCCRRRGRTIDGVVEAVDGANVTVKMEHGFVARIGPRELSPSASAVRRSSG